MEALSNFLARKCNFKSFESGINSEQIRNYFKTLMGPEKRIFLEIITSKNYITQIFCRLHKKRIFQIFGLAIGKFIIL